MTTSKHRPGQKADTTIKPVKWFRVEAAVRTYGISRSTIYELLKQGRVKSASLRKPGNISGSRLISAESLDAYIESMIEKPEAFE